MSSQGATASSSGEAEAVTTLYRLLREYFDLRTQSDGLAVIFKNYRSRLANQAWYQFDTNQVG